MERFYLHLHECGDITPDEHGQEFVDLTDARMSAGLAALGVMSEEVLRGRLCLGCYIAIEDDGHREVDRVLFRDLITVSGL